MSAYYDNRKCHIAVCGSAGVGKSRFLCHYILGAVIEGYVPVDETDPWQKQIVVNDQPVELDFFEMDGGKLYSPYHEQIFRRFYATWLFFNLGIKRSFGELEEYYKYFRDSRTRKTEEITYSDVPLFVIGNHHVVKDRAISEEQGKKFAESIGAQYLECRAGDAESEQMVVEETVRACRTIPMRFRNCRQAVFALLMSRKRKVGQLGQVPVPVVEEIAHALWKTRFDFEWDFDPNAKKKCIGM
jgi:GTPase SAR1 family protein